MSETNGLTLCREIAEIFYKALESIFIREYEDDNYMKQTILGSKWRAFWAIVVAVKNSFKPMVKVLALAIATHRLEVHADSNESEVEKLTESATDEEIEMGTRGFWRT